MILSLVRGVAPISTGAGVYDKIHKIKRTQFFAEYGDEVIIQSVRAKNMNKNPNFDIRTNYNFIFWYNKYCSKDRSGDLRKEREFVYVGEPVPKIDMIKNADFLLHYQKSILLSLVKRNLLTLSQCEKCMYALERLPNK